MLWLPFSLHCQLTHRAAARTHSRRSSRLRRPSPAVDGSGTSPEDDPSRRSHRRGHSRGYGLAAKCDRSVWEAEGCRSRKRSLDLDDDLDHTSAGRRRGDPARRNVARRGAVHVRVGEHQTLHRRWIERVRRRKRLLRSHPASSRRCNGRPSPAASVVRPPGRISSALHASSGAGALSHLANSGTG